MTERATTLGQVCEAIVDCEHKSAPIVPDGQYWAVGTSAMREGRIDYSRARRVSAKTFTDWTRRLKPRFGDLLLAREAPVGPLVRIPKEENVAPGQRTVLLRPGSDVDAGYLFALLTSAPIQARLQERAEGSTVRHLNVPDIRALALPPLPTLEEQRGIARTLGALDDKIQTDRHAMKISFALMDAMSSRHALGLPSVPLAVVAEPVRDTFDPVSFGVEVIDHFSIPAFDAQGLPDRTAGASVISTKLLVSEPSVLVSRLNPKTNRTWFAVPEAGVPAGCSTEFLVLKPRVGATLGSLWLAVRDDGYRSRLAQRVTGTSGSHQRVKPQDALDTDVPDVRQLSTADAAAADELLWLVHQRRVEITRLTGLRDALLPELLSGRIRVPEASEAVDEVLA